MNNPFETINARLSNIENILLDIKHETAEPPQLPIQPKRLYGDKAAADHIGCTHLTMSKLRKSGKVRYYSIGRRYFYYAHELDEDLRGGKYRFGELRGRRGAK
jgi:hypothetical protein